MKPKTQKRPTSLRRVATIAILSLATVFTAAFSIMPHVTADSYDEQIQKLRNENNDKESALSSLRGQAATYQEEINNLRAQINALQSQIDASVAKQNELQATIEANQKELERQRGILSETIRTMYVEGQITTIEMLATSKNLSDFVDKEEYRTTVRNKIQETLKRINALQDQLKEQKLQIERLLADQRSQQAQLDASRFKQAQLLAYNASQQSDYNNQIKNNEDSIKELQRLQAIENAKLGGGAGRACDSANGDTYPYKWCSAPLDAYIDNWGMYTRECVGYTAWKVHESGRNMPYWGGKGNANQWDDNARDEGIPVDTKPRPGDVAIKNGGTYGHAMWVEHVYADGSILISDYNQQYDGLYRRYKIEHSKVVENNLQFIHFP